MTKQEALEYWSCLSEGELIIRLGLYFAELEKASTVGVLQEQLRHADMLLTMQGEQIDRYLARIKELEDAQSWQPVERYALAFDKTDPKTKISILASGQTFSLRLSSGQAEFFIELPDDIRLWRKVKP
mgnify:FL=1